MSEFLAPVERSLELEVVDGTIAVIPRGRCGFAFADPPYPISSVRRCYPEREEVDHEQLIARLVRLAALDRRPVGLVNVLQRRGFLELYGARFRRSRTRRSASSWPR